MNKFCLTLLLTLFSVVQLSAMERTPPAVPPRTSSLPGYRIPSKPLPQAPKQQPVQPAAISSQPAMPTYFQYPPTTASTPTSSAKVVTLTPAQEKSIKAVEEDINNIMKNNVSIAKHSITLGKTASSSSILGNAKEGATIAAKFGSSSISIINIYRNMDIFSHASPEVRNEARRRIAAVTASPEFKKSVTDLDLLAADDSLPEYIRKPLRAGATQIGELPAYIVNKYLHLELAPEETIPEAR